MTESRIEAAINEVTSYGETFPAMADCRSISIKRLSQKVARELRNRGYQLTAMRPDTTSCAQAEK